MAPKTRMMSEAEAIRTINRHLRVGGFSTADIAAVMRDARLVARGSVFDYTRGGRQWMQEPVAVVAKVLNNIYNQEDPTRALRKVESLRKMKQPSMKLSRLPKKVTAFKYDVVLVDENKRIRRYVVMTSAPLEPLTQQKAVPRRYAKSSTEAQIMQLLKTGESGDAKLVRVVEEVKMYATLDERTPSATGYFPVSDLGPFTKRYAHAYKQTEKSMARGAQRVQMGVTPELKYGAALRVSRKPPERKRTL